MTRGQKRAMREAWPHYGIRFQHDEVLDLDKYFSFSGPLVIEIGFGMGHHLVHLAKQLPEHRILGIEVHRPGLAAPAGKLAVNDCGNVRLIRGDARLVFSDLLPVSIARSIIIQFPDPWPKHGDEHRRLVQPGMLSVLEKILEAGGQCLITTDVADYAEHCRTVFVESAAWEPAMTSDLQAFRVETQYEEKAIREGRKIHELYYRTRHVFRS